MKHSKVRNRWSKERRTVVLADAPEDALTQQQFVDECDVNRIMANARRGLQPKYLAQGQPHYGDFSNIPDLASSYDLIERAETAFMDLPAALRAELENDPRNLHLLSKEQAERYKLLKTLPEPQGSISSGQLDPDPQAPSKKAPKAGQAARGGTEPPSTD